MFRLSLSLQLGFGRLYKIWPFFAKFWPFSGFFWGRLYKILAFLQNSSRLKKREFPAEVRNSGLSEGKSILNLETRKTRFSIVKPKRQLFIVVPKLSLGMKILHDCEKICTTQQFLLEIWLHWDILLEALFRTFLISWLLETC